MIGASFFLAFIYSSSILSSEEIRMRRPWWTVSGQASNEKFIVARRG